MNYLDTANVCYFFDTAKKCITKCKLSKIMTKIVQN